MKRENFTITSTEGHKAIKNKWNSSVRMIEQMIREVAKSEGTYWSLVDSQSNKEDFSYVSGYRTWQREDGKQITFFINKV